MPSPTLLPLPFSKASIPQCCREETEQEGERARGDKQISDFRCFLQARAMQFWVKHNIYRGAKPETYRTYVRKKVYTMIVLTTSYLDSAPGDFGVGHEVSEVHALAGEVLRRTQGGRRETLHQEKQTGDRSDGDRSEERMFSSLNIYYFVMFVVSQINPRQDFEQDFFCVCFQFLGYPYAATAHTVLTPPNCTSYVGCPCSP